MRSFPHWSPSALVDAHARLSKLKAADWVVADDDGLGLQAPDLHWLRMKERLSGSDYLVGIGEQARTLKVISALASDLTMKDAWESIGKAEQRAKAGHARSRVLDWHGEIVSCAIAARCALSVAAAGQMPPRSDWVRRHKAVEKAAARLAKLLEPDPALHPDFERIVPFLSDGWLRDAVQHMMILDLPPREGTVEERQMEVRVERLRMALRRACGGDLRSCLDRIAGSAHNMASASFPRNASWLTILISHHLQTYFMRFLGQPLDDVVSTIASVVSETEVTTEAVKMRRTRHRKRQQVTKKPM